MGQICDAVSWHGKGESGMTVKELIEALQKEDQDGEVCIYVKHGQSHGVIEDMRISSVNQWVTGYSGENFTRIFVQDRHK